MNRAALPNVLLTPTWGQDCPRARAPNGPSISSKSWELHRDQIIEKYIHLNWKLDDVIHFMKTQQFFATYEHTRSKYYKVTD